MGYVRFKLDLSILPVYPYLKLKLRLKRRESGLACDLKVVPQ